MADTSKYEQILERLIGTITSNNAELDQLKKQAASHESILREVREHNQKVVERVDWGNLGEDVFKGVASATITKINETTGAAEKIVQNAKALEEVGNDQFTVMKAINATLQGLRETQGNANTAISGVQRAADAFGARSTRMGAWMALVGLITASLGMFGGYFYAKDVLMKATTWELGEELRGEYAQDYCGYADGVWHINSDGRAACIFWKTAEPE